MTRMTRTTTHGRRALAAACGLALALGSAQAADARLGDLDPNFDGDGIATPALPAAASLRAAAVGPGGIVYAGGSLDDGSNQDQMMVLRLTAAGALDTSFGDGGIVLPEGSIEGGAITSLAVASNGDVLAAGHDEPESGGTARLARISPGGDPVDVFLPVRGMTQVSASFVGDVELMPSGHVVLGGWATISADQQFMAMRLLPSGEPDPDFGTNGVAFADFGASSADTAAGVAVDGLGRVTLTGRAGANAAAARFTAAGDLDPAFNGTGTVQVVYPGGLGGAASFFGAVQRGDTVLAAGTITRGINAVLQALTNGAGDPGFGASGFPGAAMWQNGPVNSAESVATTSTGGAVVAGRAGTGNASQLQMAWLTPAGTADAAGGGIAARPIPLSPADPLAPGTPPVGLALTPGDGTVVAGTGPNGSPIVARFLGNAAPSATLAAAAQTSAGTPVTVDAAGSTDPEGEPLRFAFDLDGNGTYEFDGGGNPLALRSFPAPGTYTVGVRVTDPRGGTATAARSIAVAAAPQPAPEPVLGQQGVARPVRGIVRIRLPGTKKFIRLTDLAALPNGTEIDARKGRVLLTVLHDASGRLDGARFYAGRFFFKQGKGATPLTTLKLSGGSFAACRATAGRRASVLAAVSRVQTGRKRKKPVRKLWGDGRGRFRTRGKWGAATVRGTKWLTQDRCDGTRVEVERGKVDVQDLVRPRREAQRLTAGEAILIRKGG